MKNALIIVMIAAGLTAGCKKGAVIDASPIAGNWKLDKIEVDTTSGNMEKMTMEEVLVMMLIGDNTSKIRATFTDNKAIMLMDGDVKGDTSAYSLQQLGQNNYKMIVSKGDTNEEIALVAEKDKLRMKMKAVTYNFTRLP